MNPGADRSSTGILMRIVKRSAMAPAPNHAIRMPRLLTVANTNAGLGRTTLGVSGHVDASSGVAVDVRRRLQLEPELLQIRRPDSDTADGWT